MDIRSFYTVLIVCWATLSAWSQSTITTRIVYNTSQGRYEIYGRPNFTAKGYSLGPSQITVVLPAELPDDPLPIRSNATILWSDNSVVLKPAAAPQFDFHGVSTQGGKIDLVAAQDILLFDFTLKQGAVNGVRLFINGTDPGSDKPGMQGGDFRIYLSDIKGANLAVVDPTIPGSTTSTTTPGTTTTTTATTTPGTTTTTTATTTPGTTTTTTPSTSTTTNSVVLALPSGMNLEERVTVYPNPSAMGEIRLLFSGFSQSETVSIQIVTVDGKVIYQVLGRVRDLDNEPISLRLAPKGLLLLKLTQLQKQKVFTRSFILSD